MTGLSACASSPRETNARFEVKLGYADGSTEEQKTEPVRGAEVIFSPGPAERLLTTDQLAKANHPRRHRRQR
jgi:hypothetical protein